MCVRDRCESCLAFNEQRSYNIHELDAASNNSVEDIRSLDVYKRQVVNWPMGRVLMSYFASKDVRIITGLPIHDTTAGFKCYRREVLDVYKRQANALPSDTYRNPLYGC